MRQIISLVAVMLISIFLFSILSKQLLQQDNLQLIDSQTFSELVNSKKITSEVVIKDKKIITGTAMDNGEIFNFRYKTDLTIDNTIINELKKNGVGYSVEESANFSTIITLLFYGFLFFFFIKMMGAGKKMPFGMKNQIAEIAKPEDINVTFKDVAGIDEIRYELEEVVDMTKNPSKYKMLGSRVPKGTLLIGPPGTGKTLMAKAVAKEAGCTFFNVSGSEFVEMFVGVGASRVRELMAEARKHAPSIIFIDEIDAIGGKRDTSGMSGGHSEKEQTLNQLLTEMDGFSGDDNVYFLAATNREDVLDEALVRANRFDRKIHVNPPNMNGREAIFKIYLKKVALDSDLNVEELSKTLAKGTPGMTGADISNLVNEASLFAARRIFRNNQSKDNKTPKEIVVNTGVSVVTKKITSQSHYVTMEDFDNAREKLLMGPENKTLIMTDDEKRKTSYHECGHALISEMCDSLDDVHKVTIIPRARALGVTLTLPKDDRVTFSKEKAIDSIAMLMGGRVAEEIFFNGHKSTGASNDIERATQIARNMVYSWGMSDLGPIDITDKSYYTHVFSEDTRKKADEYVRNFIDEGYKKAEQMIQEHKDIMKKFAEKLFNEETLNRKQIREIIFGENGVRHV